MPDALLDEVTALVEWPVVYAGTFDPAFLAVPQECLILTMQQNQKYFALADGDGKLVPRFLVVSNLETRDPSAIVEGNERVLRARLADAKFFFDQDRKTRLEARVPKLASVVYHNKLGTQLERVDAPASCSRQALARHDRRRPSLSRRAPRTLAKADLVTDMVGEFPELQGLMGRYYASTTASRRRSPRRSSSTTGRRFAGDALPQTPVAQAVALADKLETLAGMFGIGAGADRRQGSVRPAPRRARRRAHPDREGAARALARSRRAAFRAFAGVPAVAEARDASSTSSTTACAVTCATQGYSANQVAAVLVRGRTRSPTSAGAARRGAGFRALAGSGRALRRQQAHRQHPAQERQRSGRGGRPRAPRRRRRARSLSRVPDASRRRSTIDFATGDFAGALLALASAKPAVDRYFDDVMVMADDPAIRANRLALLRGVAQTMNRVADISKLGAMR